MANSILLKLIRQIIHFDEDVVLQIVFLAFSLFSSFFIYAIFKRFLNFFAKTVNLVVKFSKHRSLFLFSWLLSLGILYPGFIAYFEDDNPIILTAALTIGSIFLIRLVLATLPKNLKIALCLLIAITSALLVTGFFIPLLNVLDHAELKLGMINTSLLKLIQSVGLIALLTWGALNISNRLDSKLSQNKQMSKSSYILFSKIFRVLLVTFSIFFGMSLVGIDLSVISFFAGAIGVAVGFGLQNILSNVFCGIILLLDRSVRPGDVVMLSDMNTYGMVHKLNARYISIRTRSGIEHLIPNEVFINKKTENWTHSDPFIRITIPFFVSIDADIDLVEKLILDIAKTTDRVVCDPPPGVRVTELKSHRIDISLRVWINDPMNGISSIKSSIYKEVLSAFRIHKISIPHNPMRIYFNQNQVNTPEFANSLDPSAG